MTNRQSSQDSRTDGDAREETDTESSGFEVHELSSNGLVDETYVAATSSPSPLTNVVRALSVLIRLGELFYSSPERWGLTLETDDHPIVFCIASV